MGFRLKIGKTIDAEVAFDLLEGDQYSSHKVALTLKRLDAEQFEQLMQRARARDISDDQLLAEMAVGSRQALVLDDNDQPAAYSPEAMTCLLGLIGLRRLLAEKAIAAQLDAVRAAAADKQGN